MARIELLTRISAPPERCFDLARSVELHMRTTAATGERAVAAVTSGLLQLGQEVTWPARHFGVWQTLCSRITAFDRPLHFRDSQMRGAFRTFHHDHFFESSAGGTVMRDVLESLRRSGCWDDSRNGWCSPHTCAGSWKSGIGS